MAAGLPCAVLLDFEPEVEPPLGDGVAVEDVLEVADELLELPELPRIPELSTVTLVRSPGPF